MEYISLEEIIEVTRGEIITNGEIKTYNNICLDTRAIKENDIFIAIKGENFDANDFAPDASNRGAAVCIIDDMKFDKTSFNKNTTVIKVTDTRKALLRMAGFYINKLNIKVVGITGSTGKTSTKDLVAAVLSAKFKVFKTIGNFNNEIGLPLMIFKLDKSYDVAVLEMGMSNFSEIHNLCEVARPDIAIITNIGMSHIENLKTRENILKAKMEIKDYFSCSSTLIVNSDNDLLEGIKAADYKLIKTGIDSKADFKACNLKIDEEKISFNLLENKNLVDNVIEINIPGRHNVLNSLLAIACAREMGMKYGEIVLGFMKLEVTSMRLDIIKGNKFTIINDAYNASPDSMVAAIDVLCNMSSNSKIVILGTMKELGDSACVAHKQVGKYAKLKNIDLLIALGEFNEAYKEGFNDIDRYRTFKTYDEVVKFIDGMIQQNDVVLVKASRYMKIESIVSELMSLESFSNIDSITNKNAKEVIEK